MKPRVITNCVANTYTGDEERIIEFSDHSLDSGDGQGPVGGLISFRRTNGRLLVRVYRCDPEVDVIVTRETPDPATEDEYRHAWSDAYWRARDAGLTTTAAAEAADTSLFMEGIEVP